MPNDANVNATPRTQTIVVQGVSFEAPAPFVEGHVLTVAEAAVLNQTLGENLRNNFASVVKAEKDKVGDAFGDAHVTALRSAFATYAAGYEFKGKRRAAAPVDPVEREAHKIAKALVLQFLREKSVDVKGLPEGKLDSYIAQALERRPEIRKEAQRRIKALSGAAQSLDIGDEPSGNTQAPASA